MCKRTNKNGVILFFSYKNFRFQKTTNDGNLFVITRRMLGS